MYFFDDKKLAMICCTIIAVACVAADISGVTLSTTSRDILSIVIAGIMGAAAGYGASKLEISAKKPPEGGK